MEPLLSEYFVIELFEEPRMRVMLIGATGYIGSAVLERLVDSGHEVIAAVRSTDGAGARLEKPGVQLVRGDASDPAALGALVRSSGAQAVIHAAAVGDWDVDQRLMAVLTSALARRENGNDEVPGALVYTSGVWVLGATNGRPATEVSPTNPIPIVAGRQDVEAAVLAQSSVRGIVIRPGIVHGRAGGIPEMLVTWAREHGTGRFVSSPDGTPVAWPMVHVEDLADLYVRAIESPGARGVLHGVAEAGVTVADLAVAAAEAAGVDRGASPWDFASAVENVGLPFAQALVLDQRVQAPAARALGWVPSRPGAVAELRSRSGRRRQGPSMSTGHDGWGSHRLDLAGYLDVIGVPEREPSRPALEELHEAHVRTFTFDNIDVLLDQHPGVGLDAVQEKFVGRGRGGYCFEHAALFAAALERLGYSVERRLGRVGSQARTHAVVAVTLHDQTFLTDPGFTLSILRPVALRDGTTVQQEGWEFQIRATRIGPVPGWQLYRMRGAGWDLLHTHDELPVHPVDFVAAHHFTSTHPGIHFRHRLMVSKHTEGGHTTLTHDAVTVRRPGRPTEHHPVVVREVPAWLDRMGVSLAPAEQARLLSRVAELGEDPAAA
jgi:N-hydroxyarylamine O-acetyltransferase